MLFVVALVGPVLAYAQVATPVNQQTSTETTSETTTAEQYYTKARVIEVISERRELIPSTDTEMVFQELRVEFLQDKFKGTEATFTNDYIPLQAGDRFIARIIEHSDGLTEYVVSDFERRPVLAVLVGIFLIAVIVFGRMQGLRSLVSLGVSIFAIFYFLIPMLLKGYDPVVFSTITAAGILFFAIFFTHGFNRKSLIAFSGTTIAVIVTGVLAKLSVTLGHITGFASHEAVYLNFNTGGTLDFAGLFLAGIMIGMLGVLDDISITQVAVVRELYGVAPHLSQKELFTSAIRVGKEHVGSLVNTLVLAYVGVALPSLLYFSTSYASLGQMINMEIFAAEVIRTMIGSIGLILTVPVTTLLAVYFLKDFKGKQMTLDELEHGHSHGHGHGGHGHGSHAHGHAGHRH